MKAKEEKDVFNLPKSDRITYLDSMRAIAIIMVVGVHSLGYCLPLPIDQSRMVSFIMHTISVPVFFLVDGYLFGRSVILSKNYNYWKYIKGSIFRLLGPWLFFTLIYTLFRYIFELTGFLREKVIVGNSWQEVLISSYGSVYAPQMYFLFSLFLIRLGSPVFKKIFFNKNLIVTVSLFFVYLLAYKALAPFIAPYLEIDGGQEPILHAIWGIQFYLAGAIIFLSSDRMDIKKFFSPLLILFVFFLIVKNQISFDYLSYILQHLYLLTFSLFFIIFRTNNFLLNQIGENTMGIYLIHAPIVLKGVSLILNRFVSTPLMSYVSILFVATVFSFLITRIIKSFPYGVLLFGKPLIQK